MEQFKTFTYCFALVNVTAMFLFTLVALIFGARDLLHLLRRLECAEIDDRDDGRVVKDEENHLIAIAEDADSQRADPHPE